VRMHLWCIRLNLTSFGPLHGPLRYAPLPGCGLPSVEKKKINLITCANCTSNPQPQPNTCTCDPNPLPLPQMPFDMNQSWCRCGMCAYVRAGECASTNKKYDPSQNRSAEECGTFLFAILKVTSPQKFYLDVCIRSLKHVAKSFSLFPKILSKNIGKPLIYM